MIAGLTRKEYFRLYREKHREEHKEYFRHRYRENHERIRESQRRYREKYPERFIQSNRQSSRLYREKHPERVKESYRKRCEKFRQWRRTIALMHGYSEDSVEIHHIDRDKENNELWNLIPLSKSEHGRISIRHQDPFTDELDRAILYATTELWN